MKPSERIKEIAYGLNNNFAERETIFAIMKYLDEEHDKQQTIITSDLTAKITMF